MAKQSHAVRKHLAIAAGNPFEEDEQRWTFDWIRLNVPRCEALKHAYSTLNGIRLRPSQLNNAKAQGHREGVLDIVIPGRSYGGEFCGLYIELKRLKGGKTSREQLEEIAWLRSQGYCADVRKGHDSAIALIKEYFQI